MGNEQSRYAESALITPEFGAGHASQTGIEAGERFVEEKHSRPAHDGARECHALSFASRELRRVAFQAVVDVKLARGLFNPAAYFVAGQAFVLQRKSDVVTHVHVRVQGVTLEHHRDAALVRRHVVNTFVPDLYPASVGRIQAGDQAQQCCFAAAGRSHQHEQLPVSKSQRNLVEGADIPVDICLGRR